MAMQGFGLKMGNAGGQSPLAGLGQQMGSAVSNTKHSNFANGAPMLGGVQPSSPLGQLGTGMPPPAVSRPAPMSGQPDTLGAPPAMPSVMRSDPSANVTMTGGVMRPDPAGGMPGAPMPGMPGVPDMMDSFALERAAAQRAAMMPQGAPVQPFNGILDGDLRQMPGNTAVSRRR